MNPDKRVSVEMVMRLVDESKDGEPAVMFEVESDWRDLPYSDYMENMQPILIKNMNDLYSALGQMGYERMQKSRGQGRK